MKSETRLDAAVFQLTPTRTRCDLVIKANGSMEKIATGLLNPFLAHLKTARDQIAKGGYSITLEPHPGADAAWFTKGTLERFVRFVSTPEILERVDTIESEIYRLTRRLIFKAASIYTSNLRCPQMLQVQLCFISRGHILNQVNLSHSVINPFMTRWVDLFFLLPLNIS
ncbi:unnamed protein product [Spirodela intermedia]|uniref:Uncharacterized protein n=1 Tax=Spirodela intermedia TaxID=51605 RepID=A0A7I8J8G1_SPIIN|nr:unnamed protein product [Spirodela intermedia]CAA6666457.1 unnamed protein product [Spirodela intermedia]